ncbi:hypothetical protein LTR36_006716 [Oleoguttula mirabilis]|uniref:Heterokaryon incompatibility domain-containing protein n=1 Tax=Oleoguttula mirabilis TaxID=1507867 RepID=A0AAV9JC17_9PEZI|nr:hypothetical protein LTR36_006716 [Oleoguttula mirabilis]
MSSTNAEKASSTASWLLEGAPALLLSKLDTSMEATSEQAAMEPAASNRAAMMKMAGAWVDLTDGAAHDHADVVKELGWLLSLYPYDPGGVKYVRQLLDRCLEYHQYSCDMVVLPHSAATTQEADSIDIVFGKNGLTKAPTRLVDVGSDVPAEPARVVAGTHCLRHVTPGYIALSYCNGETPKPAPWQLTSFTKATFEDELPLEILPQTLHDAILWTRRLGLRFIWIDNLCIIQDSPEDWQREASRMASIYGSALLTLVAASGSIYGGMTDRQNPLRNSAAALPLRSSSNSDVEQVVYILPNGQKAATSLPAPPTDRAWCYQEDVLSPRIVNFTTSQIEWQCMSDKAPIERRQGLAQLGKHEACLWYTLWYRLVERYSRKELSYAADKLVAFSGIAASKASGGTYLAGIWKEDIWAGMLWSRDTTMYTTHPGRRYETYIAPTWSWAGLDVPVAFHAALARSRRKRELPPTEHDPQVHGADVELSTFNTMGDVKGGSIVVTASSMPLITTSAYPDLFCESQQRQGDCQGRRRLPPGFDKYVVGEVVYNVAAAAKDDSWHYCILLQVTDLAIWAETGIAGIGLALRHERDRRGQAVYKRVGYVQYTSAFVTDSKRHRFNLV